MNNLIERITEAIFRQEGMKPDYPNPGNLRSAPWLHAPKIVNNFWVPDSRAMGEAGAAHCVALRIAMGQSLRQLISAWAPPVENATEAYIKNVAEWAAIPDIDVPLYTYLVDKIPT